MVFSDGDFVLIEYSVRVKETGNLVDTSIEELARKENIYDSNRVYGPTLVVIGRGWINPVVESELKNIDIGEERVIEVPPEKAFGHRDPGKVRVFSLREFQRRGIDVRVGEVIDFGGVSGVVKSVSGGRVVVDFNHPLAGKTLVYKVKVVAKLEDLTDKIKALAVKHLNIPGSELSVEYDGSKREVVIDIPAKYVTKRDIQYGKVSLATDILDLIRGEVDSVVFRERIARKKEEKEQAGSVEEPGERAAKESAKES